MEEGVDAILLSLSLSLYVCIIYGYGLRVVFFFFFFFWRTLLTGGFPSFHSENQVIHDSFFPVFGP